MNAVIRLNLLVALVFAIAFIVVAKYMLQQANKDILREVSTSLNFTQKILALPQNLGSQDIQRNQSRHVKMRIIGAPFNTDNDTHDSNVPDWFYTMIPGIQELNQQQFHITLQNGLILQLSADVSDEVEETWESFTQIATLFFLATLLCMTVIYLGVRQGIKPIRPFLLALDDIGHGKYNARLKTYSIKELNQLSQHFNNMADSLQKATERNQQLSQQMIDLQESERAFLARELHDDLGQYLTGIKMQAFLIQQSGDKAANIQQSSSHIVDYCEQMQTSFKQLIRQLHPVVLDELGLNYALDSLRQHWQANSDIKLQMSIEQPLPNLSKQQNLHLYRIIQEALHNITQHAQASQAELVLSHNLKQLELSICDNGIGFDYKKEAGLGLHSMQERARILGAQLIFSDTQSSGSCVKLSLPLTTNDNNMSNKHENIDC